MTRHYRVFAINDDGTGLPSNVDDATTDDIEAPEPQSASVPAAGASLRIVFDEALDDTSAGTPAKERFAIAAADGAEIVIGAVAVSGTDVTLTGLSPAIKSGQTVTVAYTDPTAGDDTKAVQDDDPGNDAATFEDFAVTNGSTVAPTAPGAPTGLEGGGTGKNRIGIEWTKPEDSGGRAVTGYLIEVSEAGATGPFAVLVANHNAMADGKIETAYEHTGLSAGATRHYRVKAKNSVGTGSASNVAEASALVPAGRVDIAVDPPSPAEGADVTVTVTATTSEDTQPESRLQAGRAAGHGGRHGGRAGRFRGDKHDEDLHAPELQPAGRGRRAALGRPEDGDGGHRRRRRGRGGGSLRADRGDREPDQRLPGGDGAGRGGDSEHGRMGASRSWPTRTRSPRARTAR